MTSKNTKGTGFRESRFLLPVERDEETIRLFRFTVKETLLPSSNCSPSPSPPGLMDALVTQWVAFVKVPTAFRKVVKDLL